MFSVSLDLDSPFLIDDSYISDVYYKREMPKFKSSYHNNRYISIKKRKFNSNGQQFSRNQLSEQSPLILAHWTQKDYI